MVEAPLFSGVFAIGSRIRSCPSACALLAFALLGCPMAVPGRSADLPPAGQRFELGIDEAAGLPEFLKPLESLCRRLIEREAKGTDLHATHVELSASDPSRLAVLSFDLQHDIYCVCCSGSRVIKLTDEDLDILKLYPTLEVLSLDGAEISRAGLAKVTALTGLRELSLRYTPLRGEDLSILAKLADLEHLNLWGMQVQPEHLKPLTALEKLQYLTLNCAFHDDQVLEVLGQLPRLRQLPHHPQTDRGLQHIAGLTQLEELVCKGQITDDGLAHLAGMTKLQSLFLDSLPISDRGLTHLRGMTAMKTLGVYNTNITDAGVANLGGMTQLESLLLHDTPITDAALRHLSRCTRLNWIELSGTKTTGMGFGYLDPATPLETSYGWIPATSEGLDAINRLKSWQRLPLQVASRGRQLEIRHQPQLQDLHVKLIDNVGSFRIADCPKLQTLWVECEPAQPPLTVLSIEIDGLPATETLKLAGVRAGMARFGGDLGKLRSATVTGGTTTAVLRALAACPNLESITIGADPAGPEAVTGDQSDLQGLPPLKRLTGFCFEGRSESARLAFQLLRNAESLAHLVIYGNRIAAADLEPLRANGRLQSFHMGGRRYTRNPQARSDEPWYTPHVPSPTAPKKADPPQPRRSADARGSGT